MFSNKRKTIGVFLERPANEFQNLLCQGIVSTGKKIGYNVAVFSPFGNYGKNDRYFEGDQAILQLPDYEQFAGVIVALDTMEEKSSRKTILDKIKKHCNCPVVSIREVVEGANNLLVKNVTCMEGIIRHFIEKHGFKKLCFMSGPKDRWDATERLECFQNVMAEYGLPIGEHQIFYGDYWKNMGGEACDWFLEGEEKPEAIICANDYMAVAVTSALIGRGYRIPEDICVSGYDGLSDTISFTPTITTMSVPFYEMGKRAVEIIEEKQENPKDVKNIYFNAEVHARESCGCLEKGSEEGILNRRRQYEDGKVSHNRDLQFEFFSINLGECSSIEEMMPLLEQFAYNIEGLWDYAVCLCEKLEEREYHRGYTDIMETKGAIKSWESLGSINYSFPRKELLPKEMTDDTPQIWYFAPIHFQDECYGYEAFHFDKPEVTGRLYFSWNVVIGNKIRDVLVEHKTHGLIEQLEAMYNRDMLTGMYNRRGLESFGKEMFREGKEKKSPVFLAVIDLDGMKQINDNYGHAEGDFALRKIQSIIHTACEGENISARTGGDEFVVVAKGISEEEGKSWMKGIDKQLEIFNASGQKEYQIHASYGCTYRIPAKDDTMEQFIKESDEEMYRNKMINKIRRGEQIR